ncbi:MAG: NTP transferase domain-containing protein [Opitutaceae bacterium]|nr:NTP transferase domain-containing protein [Opitutaceae bacterium]
MAPSLLVLAAGLGSRYGGLKQIEAVGPSGETLLDYAVFDAWRAGFRRIVFVIRRDFESAFREKVVARYTGRMAIDTVFQSLIDLPDGFTPPAGREKPWGTGHAVWCARHALRENFAVINADDFYGADAFSALAAFLAAQPAAGGNAYSMVGYRLDATLSEAGTVSRGLCEAGPDGFLTRITERTGIARADVGPGRPLRGDERVSMNCWGFTPSLFPALDRAFRSFLQASGGELKAEFYLPTAVSGMIAGGLATVRLLPTKAEWFGVTHREDKPRVQAALAALVGAGAYPRNLF